MGYLILVTTQTLVVKCQLEIVRCCRFCYSYRYLHISSLHRSFFSLPYNSSRRL